MSDRLFEHFQAGSTILQERQEQSIKQVKEESFDELLDRARGEILRLRRSHYNQAEVLEKVKEVIMTEWPEISYSLRGAITKEIIDELQGFGPVAELQEDPQVSDIIIVSSRRIFYQKKGQIHLYQKNGVPVGFRNIGHLRMLIEKLCMMGYARIDESSPGVVFSAKGMRITAAIPPIYCSNGDNECTVSIRKFIKVPTLKELVAEGGLTESAALFMENSARGKMNLGIAGPMGTGKTTQIAILARYFHPLELPILIESVQECPIDIPNVRRFICRPPNMEGKGEINFEQLFRLSLTSNATRVLISEALGREIFDVLQAMNAGHSGMFTFHSENARDAVFNRLPAMLMQNPLLNKGYNPFLLIGNSIHFIVVMENYQGLRRYREISEVCFDHETARCDVRPIFVRQGNELVPTGYIPDEKLEKMDYHLEELGYAPMDRAVFAV